MFKGLIDKIADFNDDCFRNISTVIPSENLLDDLSDKAREWAFGEALVADQKEEDLYSPIIMRPFSYGTALGDPPFTGLPTRFSDSKRFGIWYGSLDLITTIYETVYHFRKRLADMLIPIEKEVVSDRRVFRVHVGGILVDLRGKHQKFPQLLSEKDYTFSHVVGSYLYDNGQAGILVESIRYPDGINVAALKPDILSNPRHHCYLTYRWLPGDFSVHIEKTPGRTWKILHP